MKNKNVVSLVIPGQTQQRSQNGDLYLCKKVPYQTAWHWQQRLVAERKEAALMPEGDAQATHLRDLLIMLEHPPVYTLGHGADAGFLRFKPEQDGYELHRVERGGEVTYHCPGQIVGYPILNLHRHRLDLHWYLRQLEEVVIRTLACYGLVGDRIPGLTGVWIGDKKVAAIGIKVSRWITMHGFALNVCPDLAGFEKIVPCGIAAKSVGSLAQFLPDISLIDVQQQLVKQFEEVFQLTLHLQPLPNELKVFSDPTVKNADC